MIPKRCDIMNTVPIRIALDRVSVTLNGNHALSDVSFHLEQGEIWLVLGTNGSGKSTLLRLLRGDIWPDDDDQGARLYHYGDEPGRASPIGLRQRFGIVSPEIQRATKRLCGHLPASLVILAGPRDALYVQGRPSQQELATLDAVLDRLHIADLRDTPVEALSNGQLRAVLLARALACHPSALFLDEFLDGLDMAAQETAALAVAQAAADGTAICITSHQGTSLPTGTIKAKGLTLNGGRIIDVGSAEAVLARYQATNNAVATQHSHQQPATSTTMSPPQATGMPLVVLEHASVFLNRREVLNDISLTIHPGEHLALVGSNGAGKSTLLKLIAGEYHPALGGRALRPGLAAPEGLTDLRDIRKRIGMVSFELEAAYEKELPALDLVLSGVSASIGLYAEPSVKEIAAAKQWMDFFGVADLADRRLGQLSAGQTRRLFLARAMVGQPRLLLLDEPFAGLDAPSRRLAMEAASAAARSGVTVIAAIHNRGDVLPEIQTILRVVKGRLRPE